MSDLITLPLAELRERVDLLERAAVAARVLGNAGPVSVPSVTEDVAEEPKAAPKKRATRKKAAPKKKVDAAPPEEESPEVEEEETPETDADDGDASEEEESEYTQQDVIDLARKVVGAKKSAELKKLTDKYKLDKIRNADPKDYAAIIAALEKALED